MADGSWIPTAVVLAAMATGYFIATRRRRAGIAPAAPGGSEAAAPAVIEAPADTAEGAKVGVADVIPGKLRVSVFKHTLNERGQPVECWTYVSAGLWALGQKEIVFTVARRPGEGDTDFPHDLFQLYHAISGFAAEGRRVDAGEVTTLSGDGPGLLGNPAFRGVVYAPPQVLRGVRITAPWILGLIVTGEEAAAAQQFGVVRLMGALGRRYRFFPTAPWADRDRDPVLALSDMSQSLLEKVPRLFVPATVRQEARAAKQQSATGPDGLVDRTVVFGPRRVVLRLRPRARAIFGSALDKLPPSAPLALLMLPDPHAGAIMAWRPGQASPFAISRPDATGEVLAGGFIAFVPEQEEDGVGQVEDGFAVLLRDETWQSVRRALAAGRPLSLPAAREDRMGLAITWSDAPDPDMADPEECQSPAGWEAFSPGPSGAPFAMSLTLLTAADTIELRISEEALSDYVKAIAAVVEAHAAARSGGVARDVIVAFTLGPEGKRAFDLMARPDEGGAALFEGLAPQLEEVPAPAVRFGQLRVQLNVQLHGGSPAAAVAREMKNLRLQRMN